MPDDENKSVLDSVDIPLNETSDCCICTATGFDTTYPYQLQYRISSKEFAQSITNINNHYPKSYYCNLHCISFCMAIEVCIIVAGIIFLIIFIPSKKTEETLYFIIFGIICIILGIVLCIPSCYYFGQQPKLLRPLVEAIEKESKKYEERHCQWSLISKKDDPSIFVSRRHQASKFHIIIDINQTKDNMPMFPSHSNTNFSSKNQENIHELQDLSPFYSSIV